MEVVDPSLPKGMKVDHEKTPAQGPRQLRDFSGETLSEPSELPEDSTLTGGHGPSEPRSKKEGQIANTPNLNSCEPHRSYQYISSIKPKKFANAKSRIRLRNGCLLCMLHVNHSGVSKPTDAHDVALTVIEPQKIEEVPLAPQHTPQEPEVQMSTEDHHNSESPQEVQSPSVEDLIEKETPSVENHAGDESSDDPPVLDAQSPVESTLPQHPAENNDAKAQIENVTSEDVKSVDAEANNIAGTPAPESQVIIGPASSFDPAEEHAPQPPVEQAKSDDCKVVDNESPTEKDVPSTEAESKDAISSEQKDIVTPEPPADAPVQPEEGKEENNANVNEKNADEANTVALESFIPEEEGTGLGHIFPFANPNYAPEPLENPQDAETYAKEQNDDVTPDSPADVPVKTKEQENENNISERNMSLLANVNKKKADDAKAVALESFIPEEEGTGLGHVFPFLNPNYAPEPLEIPHDEESSAKEGGAASELIPATSSETTDEDSSNEMPETGINNDESKDMSNNELYADEPAQEHKHRHQNAPPDGEKSDKVEEVIPSNDEKERTPVEPLRVENQASNEEDVTSDAQTPAEVQDVEDAPKEPAKKPESDPAAGKANLEVEEENDGKSNMPNGETDAPITKAVSGGPALHLVLPFRTRSAMEGATAADTATDHEDSGEDKGRPEEGNTNSEERNAKTDEDDAKNTVKIQEADSLSPSESPQPAEKHLAPVEHDPELEHTSSDPSENMQDQQRSPSMKSEDNQLSTEELPKSSAISPPETFEEVSLGEPHEPDLARQGAATDSSSGGSAYQSFHGDDDTNGEDNLISQAVSNIRYETLNDRLIDRLAEDPVRVGEIMAASAQTEEEEEPKGSEKFSSVPEDLALSDENSTPELKLSEPVTKYETGNKTPPANEGDNQKSAADDHSQHDMLHDRLASSLAENPVGVSESISARSEEVGGLTVNMIAPSVQMMTGDTAPLTLTPDTLDETKDAIIPEDDVQDHQQPAAPVMLETKTKLIESTSPLPEIEAPTELAATTPAVSTPTKAQLRRAQTKRAKQRKAAERAAAASQDNEGVTTTQTAPDRSDKIEPEKTTMTKRQAKRARQTRAKQRKLEAEKASRQE